MKRTINVLLVTDDGRPISTQFVTDDHKECIEFIETHVQKGRVKDIFNLPIVAAYINDPEEEGLIHVEVLYKAASFTLIFRSHNNCYTRDFVRAISPLNNESDRVREQLRETR